MNTPADRLDPADPVDGVRFRPYWPRAPESGLQQFQQTRSNERKTGEPSLRCIGTWTYIDALIYDLWQCFHQEGYIHQEEVIKI